jgi:ubiquinone/menaquinone biosynthesis C-methylase UbiE
MNVLVPAIAAAVGIGVLALYDSKLVFSCIWRMMSKGADERIKEHKRKLLGGASDATLGLSGTIVEIGPGLGSSLKYYVRRPETITKVILVEPNERFHADLWKEAERVGLSRSQVQVLSSKAECIACEDGSVDHVVSVLVLCSVHDQHAVLREVQRVLKPRTGRFMFLEHVAASDAPEDRAARVQQRVLQASGLWSCLGDGCELRRKTGDAIRRMRGWSSVEVKDIKVEGTLSGLAPHIVGVAVKE